MGDSFASHIFKEKLMNKKNIPFVVQLKQNNNYIVQGIQQNDAGVIFDIKIMDGLEPFDFSGYGVVTLKIVKPDETVTYDSTGGNTVDIVDAENGRLKLNIPTSCTTQDGMHFCTIGFSSDETTYFESATFNYFVGANPMADDEDVIGKDEYPILGNLIALVSNIVAKENARDDNEEQRKAAELEREAQMEQMENLLTVIQQRLNDTQAALAQLNQALADGGSIDISQINLLATKEYADQAAHEASLVPIAESGEGFPELEAGELAYATDLGEFYLGLGSGELVTLNFPCFLITTNAPTDHKKLWIDHSNNTIKYYYGEWKNINAVFA